MQQRTMDVAQPDAPALPWLVAGDYRDALIHLAWHLDGQHRSLVFGVVELFPSELPTPDDTPECGRLYRDNAARRSWRVYIKRHRLPADAALAWYDACRTGTVILPDDMQADGSPKMLAAGTLAADPPWPRMVSVNGLPFVSPSWGTVRAHHLLPMDTTSALAELMQRTDALRWLSDHLLVDLVEYREWLGSLHLVAPNPVFRDIDRRRERASDGGESTVVRVVTRAGASMDGLWLELSQHGPTGITDAMTISLTAPVVRVPHVGTVETVGHRIVCPARGVLDWSGPAPYIGQIAMTVDMSVGSRTVQVPDTPSRSGETYTVPLISHTTTSRVGTPPAETPMRRIYQAQQARDLRQRNDERIERWFRDNRGEATDFVGSLISAARSRVWIIDPYFSAVEFYRFALRIVRPEIEVTIVTSAEHMETTDRVQAGEAGMVLFEQQTRLHEHGRFTILVMTGDPPLIHDRFLVIDESVWLSGNSLHTLGERAGMIVKLAKPEPIIDELQSIINGDRVVPLEEWVQHRQRHHQAHTAGDADGTVDGIGKGMGT